MKRISNILKKLHSFLKNVWGADRAENKKTLAPFIPKVWCQITKGEDPCYETANWLMTVLDPNGFCNPEIPVCTKHHPDNDFWVRRHYELNGCPVISIRPLSD